MFQKNGMMLQTEDKFEFNSYHELSLLKST